MKEKRKTVFITGASGFVGSAITKHLIENNYRIKALVRRTSDISHLEHDQIELVYGDVGDKKLLSNILSGVDFVIHAAVTFSGEWERFYKINVESTENLLNFSLKNNIKKFIYISSVDVYAQHNSKPNPTFTEDMPYEEIDHTTFYSRSKIESENLVLKYIKESKMAAVIFRPGAIYGPKGNIFPATLGLGLGEERILLIGNTKTKLPLSYVENVATAIVESLERDDVTGECFNLVENKTLSRKEYVKKIKSLVNAKLSIIHFPVWFIKTIKFVFKIGFSIIGKQAPFSSLNIKEYSTTVKYSNEKFNKYFRSNSYVDFEESIKRTMEWFKKSLTPHRGQGIKKGKVLIPSEKKINVGIIGCGNISYTHLDIISKVKNVENIYVADSLEEATKAIIEKYPSAKAYNDYKEMLDSENIDVVHVLTPPQYHAEVAEYAAQQGCHVLVEKPMAKGKQTAQKIVAAAKENNVKLCVMHNHLFDDVMIKAREILAKGSLGKITFVESWFGAQLCTSNPPYPEEHWGWQLPGAAFHDFLPHALYVLVDIMGEGEVTDVLADYSGGIPGLEHDELKVFLKNKTVLGMVAVSLSVSPRYQFLNVYGTAASMKIDLLNRTVVLDKEIDPIPRAINRILFSFKHGTTNLKAGLRNGFRLNKIQEDIFKGSARIINLFYRSILLNESEPVPGKEGFTIMSLMDQVWEKMNITDRTDKANGSKG